MKKLTVAFTAFALALVLGANQAAAWTYEDCVKVNFNHPDCTHFKTPTPKPTTPRPSPTVAPTPSKTPSPTAPQPIPPTRPPFTVAPTATPKPSQTIIPPATTTPVPTAKPIQQLPSTSTN